ncbi:hypothetical protein AVEN_111882-1 [Araneus ventricosus]|uniref:Tesmin/TSO1-like CXC domain-containing protein n=1 Tax=Araneus ventricosus TaxID=182803 RepID=A0A4Y2C061_ARAVE|nr:hypothetical protein AVEN_111882-1 [Araneus ventricosus]
MRKQPLLYRIVDTGQRLLVALYGGKDDNTLNSLKFQLFTKLFVKANFNLVSLPLTLEAARKHCFRAYLQIQVWLDQVMNQLKWGWQTTKHGLAPITTIKDPAPQSLLIDIFYKCAKGCRSTCSCRKSGIKCSAICANYKGLSCSKVPPETEEQMLQLSENHEENR